MEVRTISWSKKITAEIAINVDTIEHKDGVFEHPFTISGGDGSNYHGKIEHRRNHYLVCYVYDVESLTGSVSMVISNGKIVSEWDQNMNVETVPNAKKLETKHRVIPKFLKGTFTITFEPRIEKIVEEKLINCFSLLKQDQSKGPNDVRFVVQGKEVEFKMDLLAKISPMFKDLFDNCSSGEKKLLWLLIW